MEFKNSVAITGFGAVACALLPVNGRHQRLSPVQTVLAGFAGRAAAHQSGSAGRLRFVRELVALFTLRGTMTGAYGFRLPRSDARERAATRNQT